MYQCRGTDIGSLIGVVHQNVTAVPVVEQQQFVVHGQLTALMDLMYLVDTGICARCTSIDDPIEFWLIPFQIF